MSGHPTIFSRIKLLHIIGNTFQIVCNNFDFVQEIFEFMYKRKNSCKFGKILNFFGKFNCITEVDKMPKS